MFRVVFSSEAKNPQAMFSVHQSLASGYADSAMKMCETNAAAIASGEVKSLPAIGEVGDVKPVEITTQSLNSDYPLFAASLLNLVKNSEELIVHSKN